MTTANLAFEIEIALCGDYTPYSPQTGPGYASGGDPGYGPEVDDLTIADIGLVEMDRSGPRADTRGWSWRTTSLLDGIDRTDPAIQRLFANILDLRREDAGQAVMDAAEDGE